jgi:hypothetical protein
MRQIAVKFANHRRTGAFLRPIDTRCAPRPRERVGNITRHINLYTPDALVKPAHINSRKGLERATALRYFISVCIQKSYTKSAGHAGATIISGATANTDNDPANAKTKRMSDQFADAESTGDGRIMFMVFHAHKSAGLRHFDDGRGSISSHREIGTDWPPKRIVDAACKNPSASSGYNRFNSSITAIGNRNAD